VSPRELVEGIVYGMIGVSLAVSFCSSILLVVEGYLNYFKKMWMHHDFSVGDVMLLRKRPPFQEQVLSSILILINSEYSFTLQPPYHIDFDGEYSCSPMEIMRLDGMTPTARERRFDQ
jgi:hypothetical protein